LLANLAVKESDKTKLAEVIKSVGAISFVVISIILSLVYYELRSITTDSTKLIVALDIEFVFIIYCYYYHEIVQSRLHQTLKIKETNAFYVE